MTGLLAGEWWEWWCTPVQTQACQSTVSSLAVVAAKPNRYSHSGAYTSCNSVSRRPQWAQSLSKVAFKLLLGNVLLSIFLMVVLVVTDSITAKPYIKQKILFKWICSGGHNGDSLFAFNLLCRECTLSPRIMQFPLPRFPPMIILAYECVGGIILC